MAKTTTKKPAVADDSVEMVKEEPARIVPKEIDPNQYITVRNGFHGTLVYKSRKTGEVFIWDSFGSEQEIELSELRNARNSSKAFFINNWFMFDEDYSWVIDYLGMRQYYKHSLTIDAFDDIFKQTPAQIKKTIAELSDGQKKTVAYRASELIANGEIDSRKVITALEEALGIQLIEK